MILEEYKNSSHSNLSSVKKILITGVTGFLGRHFIKVIANEKYEIYCITRNLAAVKNLPQSENIHYVYGELELPETIDKYFKGIHTCIHLAAETISSSKKKNHIGNVLLLKNVVLLCKRNNVKKIIFTSSANARFKKLGIYGRSKLEAENVIKNSGINYIILLPTLIYGYGDKGLSKTIKFIKKLPVIPVIGNGKSRMQPVFVADVVDAIKNAVERDINNEIYYLGGPESFSFNEFVNMISEKLGLKRIKLHFPFELFYYPTLFFSKLTDKFPISLEQCISMPQDKRGDISKARKDLGYDPINFKDGLNIKLGGQN